MLTRTNVKEGAHPQDTGKRPERNNKILAGVGTAILTMKLNKEKCQYQNYLQTKEKENE